MRRFLFYILMLEATGAMSQSAPHFSQFYSYPLWLNPAMTGVIDGDYRITGIYRKQWSGIVPYSTAGLSAGITTGKNISIGLNFMNQSAGDAGYNYINAYGSVSYDGMKFGTDGAQRIRFGIQAGMLSRKFDPAKFRFGDRWNSSTGYDPAAPTTDLLTYTSVTVLDLGAGIFYEDGSEGKRVNPFGGVAAFHLTRPEDPFVGTGQKERLPVRYVVHGGARIEVSETFRLIPHLVYMRQGNAQEKMGGLYGEVSVTDVTNLLFGMYYRVGDAVVPFAGVSYQHITLGISYDVGVSGLGNMVNKANSIELSLSYTGRGKGRSLPYLGCPRF